MSKQTKSNSRLIGAKVLFDIPVRWKTCDPKYRDQMRAEQEATEHLFGFTGEIVDVHPENDQPLQVLLDGGYQGTLGRLDRAAARKGELVNTWPGGVTVLQLAPEGNPELQAILAELQEIKEILAVNEGPQGGN
jgi:hypothetical protein